MKYYLASSYRRRDELRKIREILVNLGHSVTSRWLDTNYDLNARIRADDVERIQYSMLDWEDVQACDCLIMFAEPAESDSRRGGRHVEFGMAIGLGKQVILIGIQENIFHHLPFIAHYDTFTRFMEKIWYR